MSETTIDIKKIRSAVADLKHTKSGDASVSVRYTDEKNLEITRNGKVLTIEAGTNRNDLHDIIKRAELGIDFGNLRKALKSGDTDGNGKLSDEELNTLAKTFTEQLAEPMPEAHDTSKIKKAEHAVKETLVKTKDSLKETPEKAKGFFKKIGHAFLQACRKIGHVFHKDGSDKHDVHKGSEPDPAKAHPEKKARHEKIRKEPSVLDRLASSSTGKFLRKLFRDNDSKQATVLRQLNDKGYIDAKGKAVKDKVKDLQTEEFQNEYIGILTGGNILKEDAPNEEKTAAKEEADKILVMLKGKEHTFKFDPIGEHVEWD